MRISPSVSFVPIKFQPQPHPGQPGGTSAETGTPRQVASALPASESAPPLPALFLPITSALRLLTAAGPAAYPSTFTVQQAAYQSTSTSILTSTATEGVSAVPASATEQPAEVRANANTASGADERTWPRIAFTVPVRERSHRVLPLVGSFFLYILHFIQHTPRKLSAERKGVAGAKAPSRGQTTRRGIWFRFQYLSLQRSHSSNRYPVSKCNLLLRLLHLNRRNPIVNTRSGARAIGFQFEK